MRLEWSRRAELDLRDGITFIAKEDPRAADAIEDRILEAASGLMTFPESGRTGRRTGTRELVVRRTP